MIRIPSFRLRSTTAILLGISMAASVCGNEQEGSKSQNSKTEIVATKVETLIDDLDSGTGGLAIDKDGNIYSADFGWRLDGRGKGGDKVFRISAEGESKLFCRRMRGASGNCFDADGNLFQSSIGGNFISKIDKEGNVSVFARGLKNPVGVVSDKDGNLFVCNCGGGSIQKITKDGQSEVWVQDKRLKCPNGIVQDQDGNFYVANFSNGDVIKITPEKKVSKLATIPGKNNGHLCFHEGSLYVVARAACQIYKVDLDGKATVFAGSGKRGKGDGLPKDATFSLPNDIGVSPDGTKMYVNETSPTSGDHRILGPTRIRIIHLKKKE